MFWLNVVCHSAVPDNLDKANFIMYLSHELGLYVIMMTVGIDMPVIKHWEF